MEQSKNKADPFKLQCFVEAQDPVYPQVLTELRQGRKRSHWMWFIFPQVAGLGRSAISQRYAIQSGAEARAYLAHPFLGARLRECVTILLEGDQNSAHAIFGQPDTMKFRSSMTLFAAQAGEESLYSQALDKFFDGQPDTATLDFLADHP
ncbi:DUF1810 domain-containing protein [bacterium]|nr:DUF1810 domain-containing protein [bacterium]